MTAIVKAEALKNIYIWRIYSSTYVDSNYNYTSITGPPLPDFARIRKH